LDRVLLFQRNGTKGKAERRLGTSTSGPDREAFGCRPSAASLVFSPQIPRRMGGGEGQRGTSEQSRDMGWVGLLGLRPTSLCLQNNSQAKAGGKRNEELQTSRVGRCGVAGLRPTTFVVQNNSLPLDKGEGDEELQTEPGWEGEVRMDFLAVPFLSLSVTVIGGKFWGPVGPGASPDPACS
jgi:hypothetical protein